MDLDELFAKKGPGDPLVALLAQDLDRLSLEELEERIAALEAEVGRCRARISSAVNHRATAENLFRR
ncbi:DUF1192 domain-containing protein [Sphingomonas naphthae]|uniref:DUF1192 domain-containing protein n=1 Tax=Sphingomonas naphthae TaxID=1813468 RepID=A0ABY7THW8_9SPHN|nr:DUF1192 domain-containing protein [Sphingomonas naphthae]WCT72798.1 DUF1192 domain-containing protein [Sphingomonas naphthae]